MSDSRLHTSIETLSNFLRPRRATILFGLMVILILAFVSRQYWLFPANLLPSPSRDLKSNLLPIVMYKVQLASAEFPLTSPWYSEQSNFLNPLWNFLYVPATVFFLFLPLTLAARLVIFFHILLGWFFMQLLLKEFTERDLSAYFGAFLYVFSGIWTARLMSYHLEKIIGLAILPAVLYFFKRTYDQPSRLNAVFIALALAALVYAGAMYLLVFALVSLVIASLLLFVQEKPNRQRLTMLLLALFLFLIFSGPKLIPNYLGGASSPRPQIFVATFLDLFTTLILPGDLWPVVLPLESLWRWNEITIYISVAALALALVGMVGLVRSQHRRWLLPLLGVSFFMFYWSLGFPPFGIPAPLVQLRTASRALMIPGFIACILAAIGLDALIVGRLKFPWWGWVLIVVGMLLETMYVVLRGYPEFLDAVIAYTPNANLPAERRVLLDSLLNLERWQAASGWVAGLLVVGALYVLLRIKKYQLPMAALILAALALFSTITAQAGMNVKYESNPFDDTELARLRQDVDGGITAIAANVLQKDVRGRIELALSGRAHLLNPYYGSFGQEVSPDYIEAIDYVISTRELAWDVAIMRHWSPYGELATIPLCSLSLVGSYETEDPLTRNDLETDAFDLSKEPDEQRTQTLYLYHVDRQRCPDSS